MSLTKNLKAFATKFFVRKNAVFTVPVEKQKNFINKLPAPKDNFDRSFLQFKCQMFMMGFFHYPLNIALGILYFYNKKAIKHISVEKAEGVEALFCTEDLSEDVLPHELYETYPSLIKIDPTIHLSLNEEDRKFLKLLARKYPFRWHFRFKIMLKMAMYRYIIDTYNPKALIVSSEYSFTSSIITEYLERQGIKHINIMHGEKLYNISDSFVNFTEYYLWDKYYIDLLGELKANTSCLKVAVPPVLKLQGKTEKEMDLTYYLTTETPEEVQKVVDSLVPLAEKGLKVAVRSHPRYTYIDREMAESKGLFVEGRGDIPFEDSLLRTKLAASLYSTVLFQAYCNGIPFAIDDINRPELYKKLEELEYVGLSIDHKLLSEIIESEK